MAEKREPRTLLEAVQYFSDPDVALNFVVKLRWPNGQATCPRCGCVEVSFISTRRIWKCRACRRQFSVKVGSIFEDSPISLTKWLIGMWLVTSSKNSISSYEFGRSLGVSQKCGWFMLHRLREAMDTRTFEKMHGTVEVDETYVGGKGKFVHRNIVVKRGFTPKTVVQGARERETGRVRADVVGSGELRDNVYRWVEPGSTVYTDEHPGYRRIGGTYVHAHVTHSGPSATRYVHGDVSTNGIENFWAIFKRALKGTQVHASRAHMVRYVVEREFAYNYREETDLMRMRVAVSGIGGRRLTWASLTTR